MDIQDVIDKYHKAADEFSRGDSLPVKMLFSNRNDVILANPFGPPVVGWNKVSDALDFASSRFKDGEVISFESMAKFETPALVVIFEIEKWKAKVSGRGEVSSFDLRVTSIFRNEDGGWKLIHRHADPITTLNSDGPLRN